jgi:hypothetical protein
LNSALADVLLMMTFGIFSDMHTRGFFCVSHSVRIESNELLRLVECPASSRPDLLHFFTGTSE